jgi:hypothetical protein
MSASQINNADDSAACSRDKCGCDAVNVGKTERILSIAAGAALAVAGLRRFDSPFGWLLAAIGGGTLYRGLSGHCYTYQWLGISTADEENAALQAHVSELLDEAGAESFPASDPPAVSAPRAERPVDQAIRAIRDESQ